MLLFEVGRMFRDQEYLNTLYKALFALAYYGLMRIGELVHSPHTLKATNIHIGQNKNKILIILHTSKTHGLDKPPQRIKIAALRNYETFARRKRFFCPFELVRNYIAKQGDYATDDEEFFIFQGLTPIQPTQIRSILKILLEKIGLNPDLYDTHSFRIGHASQMLKNKISIDEIRTFGRWSSSCVYKYLKM